MKKIIASACAVMAMGFAAALAHADDSASQNAANSMKDAANSAQNTSDSLSQGSQSLKDSAQSAGSEASDTASNTASKWKSMKTCTDADGVTYYKGKKGFESCVAQMKKAEKHKEQMGGTATESDHAKDMNSSDTSSAGSSSTDSSH